VAALLPYSVASAVNIVGIAGYTPFVASPRCGIML
jgi:hypothetical protein